MAIRALFYATAIGCWWLEAPRLCRSCVAKMLVLLSQKHCKISQRTVVVTRNPLQGHDLRQPPETHPGSPLRPSHYLYIPALEYNLEKAVVS